MLRAVAPLLSVFALLLPSPALAWGKTGRRVVAAVAEPYLPAAARAGIKRVLGVESMAEA
jgi:hypothetical protein